jgi:hypothetical protein
MDNAKFGAMLTLEGRRNDDTQATREAEQVLLNNGWTKNMIATWRKRNIKRSMRATN